MSLNAFYFALGSALLMSLLALIAGICFEIVLEWLGWLPWRPSRRWRIAGQTLYWGGRICLVVLLFLSIRNWMLGASPEAATRVFFLGVGFYGVVACVKVFVHRWSRA